MICPTCGQEISSQNRNEEVSSTQNTQDTSILDAYEDKTVKKAIPKVSDYRERYKKKEIRIDDLRTKPTILKVNKQDGGLDRFNYKGEGLFFGAGIEQEI